MTKMSNRMKEKDTLEFRIPFDGKKFEAKAKNEANKQKFTYFRSYSKTIQKHYL